MLEKLISKFWGETHNQEPDFWQIRTSFIEYIDSESDVLKVCDFDKKNFAGVYIGCNPNNCDNPKYLSLQIDCDSAFCQRPQSFLSAGINHGADDPKNAKLKSVKLSAYWMTFAYTEFERYIYYELKPYRKKIQEVFGFQHLDFKEESNFSGIGIWKRSVDLTEKEQIHSHFKWIKQNLEKLYWLVHLHETGCLNWE